MLVITKNTLLLSRCFVLVMPNIWMLRNIWTIVLKSHLPCSAAKQNNKQKNKRCDFFLSPAPPSESIVLGSRIFFHAAHAKGGLERMAVSLADIRQGQEPFPGFLREAAFLEV